MKRTYQSKIGLELVIPLLLLFGTLLVLMINEKPSWAGIAILLAVALFVVHLFLTTNYTIDEEELKIKSGFIFNRTIDIKTIKRITETRNLLSSPATSLDRLAISFGKSDCVIVSPKHKTAFIDEIKKLNPNVEVQFRAN